MHLKFTRMHCGLIVTLNECQFVTCMPYIFTYFYKMSEQILRPSSFLSLWIEIIYVYVFLFCDDNFQVSWIELVCNLLVKFLFSLKRSNHNPPNAAIAMVLHDIMTGTPLSHTPTCYWHSPILDFNSFCWHTVGCHCRLISISFKADVTHGYRCSTLWLCALPFI